jgi:hypothetical protein
MFHVSVDFSDVETILKNHGLQEAGQVQKFFTSELMRLSDPYVPFRSGPLKNSVHALLCPSAFPLLKCALQVYNNTQN